MKRTKLYVSFHFILALLLRNRLLLKLLVVALRYKLTFNIPYFSNNFDTNTKFCRVNERIQTHSIKFLYFLSLGDSKNLFIFVNNIHYSSVLKSRGITEEIMVLKHRISFVLYCLKATGYITVKTTVFLMYSTVFSKKKSFLSVNLVYRKAHNTHSTCCT